MTSEELEVEMTEWDAPMILDVFATWCGPCVQLKPEVEKVRSAELMGCQFTSCGEVRIHRGPLGYLYLRSTEQQ